MDSNKSPELEIDRLRGACRAPEPARAGTHQP